jgi:hypothetical protein
MKFYRNACGWLCGLVLLGCSGAPLESEQQGAEASDLGQLEELALVGGPLPTGCSDPVPDATLDGSLGTASVTTPKSYATCARPYAIVVNDWTASNPPFTASSRFGATRSGCESSTISLKIFALASNGRMTYVDSMQGAGVFGPVARECRVQVSGQPPISGTYFVELRLSLNSTMGRFQVARFGW